MAECCGNVFFSSVQNYHDVDFRTQLQINLKYFLDYGFLSIGAWDNSDEVPTCKPTGLDYRKLTKLTQPKARSYTQYAAPRRDWIWEGATYNGTSPKTVKVYVDGVDKTADFTINYPLGIVTTNTSYGNKQVTADYSYRLVQVFPHYQAPWWNEIVNSSFAANADNQTIRSELYSIFAKNRVQTPFIVIESSSHRSRGAELGSKALWITQDMILNITADNVIDRDKILSLFSGQQNKDLRLFNSDKISFPLDCNGTPDGSGLDYPDFVQNAPWRCSRITNVGSADFSSPCSDLYFGRIRLSFEIYHPFGA